MRSNTSLALGLVALLAAACGSENEPGSSPAEPSFTGTLPQQRDDAMESGFMDSVNGAGSVSENGSSEAGQSPAPSQTPSEDSSDNRNEAPVEDAVLDMNQPAGEQQGGEQADPPAMQEAEPVVEEPSVEEPVPPPAEPEPVGPQTQVFILFGQSNMWGVPNPQQQDLAVTERAEVLTLQGCGQHGANEWVPAQPPLHGCVGQPGGGNQGPGLGPGDYFAKVLTEAFPQDTILLVPNADPGVSIDVFQPGQQRYNNMLNRSRMAQERGEIRGILFHQGETDTNQQDWPNRVSTVVTQLRADLGIGDVPFIAGELLPQPQGCCGSHNQLVNQLPNLIPNAFVVSAAGAGAEPNDGFGNLHFDVASVRVQGTRFGEAFLGAIGN